jgi:hypothetical protein
MKAIKDNREYTIGDDDKERYLQQGYDVYDESGKLLEAAHGKSVPWALYQAKCAECESLKEQLKKKNG